MMKRILLQTALLIAVLYPSVALAQGQSGDEAVMGLPVIEVRLESSASQLFFTNNIYVPGQITATVWVKNISTDTAIARNVNARLIKDTRFKLPDGDSPDKHVADFLNPGDEASVTYTLEVASARADDGLDTIRVLVWTDNAYAKTAEYSIWVEREMYPILGVTQRKLFTNIVF
jgi:hypothetical protein